MHKVQFNKNRNSNIEMVFLFEKYDPILRDQIYSIEFNDLFDPILNNLLTNKEKEEIIIDRKQIIKEINFSLI
jgi:hypothetical protein